jgi:hypothetical protein
MDRREALDQITLEAQSLRERIGFLVGGFGIIKCRLPRPRVFLIVERAEWPTAGKLKPVFFDGSHLSPEAACGRDIAARPGIPLIRPDDVKLRPSSEKV